jgi:hypothetical protein
MSLLALDPNDSGEIVPLTSLMDAYVPELDLTYVTHPPVFRRPDATVELPLLPPGQPRPPQPLPPPPKPEVRSHRRPRAPWSPMARRALRCWLGLAAAELAIAALAVTL